MPRSLLVVLLLSLAPLATAQQIYKWKDANGTVHYSQTAPASGVHYQQMTLNGVTESSDAPPATPAASPADAAAPAAEAAPAAPVADTPANRAKLCTALQTNLAALHGGGPVVMQNAGQTKVLDANQRAQQLTTANAQYQQFCAGK